jgi:hypothetical protein
LGYNGLPVLKTGWATGPVPLQGCIQAEFGGPTTDERERRVNHTAMVPMPRTVAVIALIGILGYLAGAPTREPTADIPLELAVEGTTTST